VSRLHGTVFLSGDKAIAAMMHQHRVYPYHSHACSTDGRLVSAMSVLQGLVDSNLSCMVVSLQVLLFFTVAAYTAESSYGVVETLINPILSDYFGFTEKEISYFFMGSMLVYIAGSLLL